MTKKLFTKVVSVSLAAAMVLSMAPVNAAAAKAVKPKSMKAPKSSMIKVGQTKTITATRKAKKSDNDVKYVKFSPKKTKNIGISVKTSDDAVVSVEKVSDGRYTYTGVNAGEATLTITSRAKTEKGKKLKATMDITVINPFKVTQTGAYTFTMSTADKLEKVDKRDVKVVQEGNTVDNAVKSVKISEDKMSVEVTMEIPFVDQKKYEVTFGKDVDSFVASVGAPAAINIKTQTAVVNKPTEIEYAVVDAKGMDVTKVLDASKLSMNVTVKTGYYDPASKKLTLWKVGDTAEVTVTYHTWTYDATTGKENVVEGKGTVTCVDKSAVTVTGLDKWTIADKLLSWDTDTMKTTIAAESKSNIWVRMKKSDGTYVDNKKNAADFTFDPIYTGTLYVYADGSIYATREGMEYAKVTYFDGAVKYQYTLPITVGAKSKATTLVLSQSYVVISKDAAAGVGVPITLKVLNQYGDEMRPDMPTSELLSGKDVATFIDSGLNATNSIRKIAVGSNANRIGTGVYKLSANGLTISITVSAQDVSAAASGYMLKPAVNEIDISIDENTENAVLEELKDGVKLDFFETKAGLLDKNANAKFTAATIKVNNKPVGPSELVKKNVDGSLVFQPVIKQGNDYVVQATAGAYSIEATAVISGKTVVTTAVIIVKNTTQAPKENESYEIGKLVTSFANVPVEDVVDEIVVNKLSGGAALTTSAPFAMILHNAAPVVGAIDTTVADAFYLDTAALPSFKTEGGKFIWVVKSGLHKAFKVVKAAEVTGNLDVVSKAQFHDGDTSSVIRTAEIKVTGTHLENLNYSDVPSWTLSDTDAGKFVIDSVTLKASEPVTNPANGVEEITVNVNLKPVNPADNAADAVKIQWKSVGTAQTVLESLQPVSLTGFALPNTARGNVKNGVAFNAGTFSNITAAKFNYTTATVEIVEDSDTTFPSAGLKDWGSFVLLPAATAGSTTAADYKIKPTQDGPAAETGDIKFKVTFTGLENVEAAAGYYVPETLTFTVKLTVI